MKDKFVIYFTKRPTGHREISLTVLLNMLGDYFRKVFYYATAQLGRRRKSYRSMIIVSVVLLSFVFTNLILNEARITEALSQSFGGIHHVMFLGVDGAAAKGASEHKAVKECLIVPVIAEMPSSVDSSVVGKVAVLTEDVASFMQIHMTHGTVPHDNEIIVPGNLYSAHSFLTLGEEQDMYFESDALIYRSMTLSGIYGCTDQNSPYVFVNETTGEEIKAATGHRVTFDVYLTLTIASDRNAAKVAGEIIRKNGIGDTAEQQVYTDSSSDRSVYRDYINSGTASYRDRNGFGVYRIASAGAVVIAALIMTSFFTEYTARHIGEYGILVAYGAKRRHLLGVVMGQVLFVTALSLLPVLLLSFGGAYLYNTLYNQARVADSLPVIVSVPMGELVKTAVWYVTLLCILCAMTMRQMFSQLPYPMIRGSVGRKLPFVRHSSNLLFRVRDKVRYLAFLQSLRLVKGNVIPALATSVICIVCAMFLGVSYLNIPNLTDMAADFGNRTFDGIISATDHGSFHKIDGLRGYPTTEDMATLASFDGVKTVGGIRAVGGMYLFELFCNGRMTTVSPVYCDREVLPYLYGEIREGDPNAVYTIQNSLILVDSTGGSNVHAGDVVTVECELSGRREMTVAAVVSGAYFAELDLPMADGSVIMSNETGETVDGFPVNLRKHVCFKYDEGLSDDEYAAISHTIGEHVDMIRYQVTFYETERLRTEKNIDLENGVTTVMIVLLYLAMCVLDYTHAKERILSQKREFCILRQMGAHKRAVYKTTRTSVYAGQVLAFGFTVTISLVAFALATGYCTNLANMYRMHFGDIGQVTEAMLHMVREMQNKAYEVILGIFALTVPLHGLAFLTAVLGTVLPTCRIMKESIAAVLKGSAEG